MNALTVTDDMQIIIPREVTEDLGLKPGQKLQALDYDGQIRLVEVLTVEEARGFLGPSDMMFEREPDRQL